MGTKAPVLFKKLLNEQNNIQGLLNSEKIIKLIEI